MNAQTLKPLENKLDPGLVFQMSKVAFAENTKQQYIRVPLTVVASMADATFSTLRIGGEKLSMPAPVILVVISMGSIPVSLTASSQAKRPRARI